MSTSCLAQDFWEQTNGPRSFSGHITYSPDGTIYIAGAERGVFRSTNNGISWMYSDSGLLTPVWTLVVSNSGDVFAGTDSGLYRSTDLGSSWQMCSFAGKEISDLSSIRDGRLFASVFYGAGNFSYNESNIFESTNGGNDWEPIYQFRDNEDPSSMIIDSSLDFFVSDYGGIFRSEDSGKSWLLLDSSIYLNLGIYTVSTLGTLFANDNGKLLQSTNRGDSWDTMPNSDPHASYIYYFLQDPNGIIFTVGPYHPLTKSIDGGKTWMGINPGLGEIEYMTLDYTGALVVSASFGVYRSTDEGKSWVAIGIPDSWVSALAVSDSGNLIVPHYLSTDKGDSWAPSGQSDGGNYPEISTLLKETNGDLIEADDYGFFFISNNQGVDWNTIPSPRDILSLVPKDTATFFVGIYQKGVAIVSLDSSLSPRFIGLDSQNVGTLAIDHAGNLFATTDSQIFRSTDNGTSWVNISQTFPSTSTNTVFVTTSNQILASTGAGVFISLNDGDTWLPFNNGLADSTIITSFVENSKGMLFAGTENGVYMTTIQNGKWVPINSGLTAHYVVTLACDSKDVLYAGTAYAGVFKSVLPSTQLSVTSENSFSIILQNSPNPLTSSTSISFTLSAPAFVTLTLMDCAGREIRTLENDYLNSGSHSVPFERGNLPAGVYFYRLTANGASQTAAMVIE